MSTPFAPPTIGVGEVVLFAAEAGAAGVPAIVQKVGPGGALLDVLIVAGRSPTPKFGIRHEGDPTEPKGPIEGVWRLSDADRDLRARLEALERATGAAAAAPKKR